VASGSLGRRAGLIAAGQATVKASQLVIAIALVRLLSPATWSQVALLLSIYLAAVTIGTLNLQQSLLFFLPRLETAQRRRMIEHTAIGMAGMAIVIAAGMVALTPWLSHGRPGMASAIPLVALAIVLEIPCAAAPPSLLSIDRLALAATWDIVTTTALVVAVVVAAAQGWGIDGIAGAILVAAFVRFVLFVSVIRWTFPGPTIALPPGVLRKQVLYGLPLGLTIAASVLNRSVDKWLVAAFAPDDLGVYTVAAQEIPLLAVLPYAGGAAVVTRVIDAFRVSDPETARGYWIHQTAVMSAIVVPMSAALILVAPQLLDLVFTPEYAAGVLPFQLFTAITLHRVAEYGLVLRAADRTRDLLLAAVVLLAANLVLAGLGAWWWGMVGASLGTLLANLIAWVFVLGRLADAFGSDVQHSFAWMPWALCVATSAAAVAIATVAARLTTSSPISALTVEMLVFVPLVLVGHRWTRQFVPPPPAEAAAQVLAVQGALR